MYCGSVDGIIPVFILGKTHTIFGPDGVLQRQRAQLASAHDRARSKSGLGAVTSEAGMVCVLELVCRLNEGVALLRRRVDHVCQS